MWIAAAALLLAACAATGAADERDALLVAPDATVREALARAVAAGLGHGTTPALPPALSEAALTSSSQLSVEPVILRDPMGLRLNGRERRPPAIFRLLIDAEGRCILTQPARGTRQILLGARCVPAGA